MSQERLSMRKISEVMRLKWACGLSNRVIGRSCQISHSTVSEYLKRAEAAGLKWPLPERLDEDSLYRLLFPERAAEGPTVRVLPDWETIHKELKKRNVTLRLLWTEYRESHPEEYGYSQYCDLYRRQPGITRQSLRAYWGWPLVLACIERSATTLRHR